MLTASNVTMRRAAGFELQVDQFSAAAGCLVAIVGPNGSGKSSLCSALSGVDKQLARAVKIHDQPIGNTSANRLAQTRAVLLQSTAMSSDFLVSDVVLMGAHAHARAGTEAIEARLAQIIERLELERFMSRRMSTLSGGQQQRVHIARCLLQGLLADKPIMLFDEPVAALDVAWQHKVMSALAELAQSATVVVVLHELNLALQYAGDVYVLKNGSVVANGAPEEVLTESCLTATYGWPFSVVTEPQRLIYSLPQTTK